MPGTHNKNTQLIGFYADLKLVAKVDRARKRLGLQRSQFLREAAVAYMEKRGIKVPPHLKNAPDRKGKGGPSKYRHGSAVPESSEPKLVGAQGFPPSSKVTSALELGADLAAVSVQHQNPESTPSSATAAPTARKGRPTHGTAARPKNKPATPTSAPK